MGAALTTLLATLPDAARDLRLNLGAVLAESTLSPAQRWGVAVASAIASRSTPLRDAIVADARAEGIDAAVLDDAVAAAALMGMNNVFYRFRTLVERADYGERPARLRMNRLARPSTSRTDLELFSLAVSAIHGCGSCVKAHEKVVTEAGVTVDQVHDAVRVASVVHGVAVGLAAV